MNKDHRDDIWESVNSESGLSSKADSFEKNISGFDTDVNLLSQRRVTEKEKSGLIKVNNYHAKDHV